jgi:hypothetical protein
MNKLAFLLLVPLFIFGQVFTHLEDTKSLFKDGKAGLDLDMPFGADSINLQYKGKDYNGRPYEFYMIHSDTLGDTLISKRIDNNNRYGDLMMTFGLLSDSAMTGAYDTISVTFDMGVFRGHGYDYSSGKIDSAGVAWYSLFSAISADTSLTVSLEDSTWFSDNPTTAYWVRIRELYTQKNRYFWNIFQFGEK